MFFTFASWHAGNLFPFPNLTRVEIEALLQVHPQVLLTAIEQYYTTRRPTGPVPNYSDPGVPALPAGFAGLTAGLASAQPTLWDHIIYAYMIENTRIFEIFDRVVRDYEAGERFETPDPDTALWLRTTEALFYRDLPSGSIAAMTSWLRPDSRATRRNTYYRLLGLDLNHGLDGNQPYRFDKPTAANRDFVGTFESFLREVWRGMMNAVNSSGPDETDDAAIADHVRRLREMLRVRRINGNLLREELWAVVTMSWFHLTVAANTPVVRALKADAESPGDRLRKIGERVGVPVHGRADDYFSMAFQLSQVLSYIELTPATATPFAAPGFYLTGLAGYGTLPADMRTIITHWSAATGRSMKALPVPPSLVAPSPRREISARPASVPTLPVSRSASGLAVRTNGS